MKCFRYLISGKVQGVFFRQSAKIKADSLGLKGSAENLESGQVEIIICGAENSLKEFDQWVITGPPLAKVSTIEKHEVEEKNFEDFSILRKK